MKKILIFLYISLLSLLSFGEEIKPIEVLYFHNSQRCPTCIAIENATKDTIKKNFSKEIDGGKLVFRVVDISKKENEKIADKYRITFSSLLIVKSVDGKDCIENLTRFAFATARNQPNVFAEKLTESIKNAYKPTGESK